MTKKIINLSQIDQDRFGVKTAKTNHINTQNLRGILAYCHSQDVDFLIVRLPVSDIKTLYALEENNFHLMQTLIYFRNNLMNSSPPEDHGNHIIREVKPGEEKQVASVAREAFTGYSGHYHADSRLKQHDCTEVYSSWAERCCVDPNVADCVFVAVVDGNIVGFRAIRMNSSKQGEMLLSGVLPFARKTGIYTSFVVKALNWCKKRGVEEVITSTIISNIGVQKVCIRLGFEPFDAFYTYHKWFDES